MAIKAEPSFSLKDELFNKQKVTKIADEIEAVYPQFQKTKFINLVSNKFPELDLMERLLWIRDCLRKFLPDEYQSAATILVKSLPTPCDPNLSDDDFGDFIYGPYGAFVAEYGCTKVDLKFSLAAIKEMTTRFSCEFPIRSFLNAFPKETLAELNKWTKDRHYHVRRLVSEGTRPNLPWAKKITIDYRDPLPFLDVLHADKTRFVTRSVANHLNDIAKLDPELVVQTLERWQKEQRQSEKELQFITKHSLRTLEKQGYKAALDMLGYQPAKVELSQFKLTDNVVKIGEALEFSFSITSISAKSQQLLVDYNLFFLKANGSQAAKTFKITKIKLQPGETQQFSKRQPLRPMTTRTLYPGEHSVELQINGETYPRKNFNLRAS